MFLGMAQKPAAWFDHTQLFVHNLDSSVAFYTKVFQVDTILCRCAPDTISRRIKWLKVGEDVELHLWQSFSDTATSVNPLRFGQLGFTHLGFMVTSMDAFVKRLNEVSSDYRTGKLKINMGKMPYGAKTTIIRDPDGNMIHVIEAMSAKQ